MIQTRRGRHRGRRRHGVDDQRAVPAPGRPGRLPPRRPDRRRLDDVRRPVLRLRPGRHGRRHREVRRVGRPRARAAGRARRHSPTSGRPRPARTACSTTRSSRSRSRSARATRSSSRATRASAATPPPSRLGGLRPAFDKAGNITAGNASQISDGGAAVIVTSKAKAEELGVTPLGEIVGYGQVAGPDPSLLTQPARAIKAGARARPASRVGDIDLFELNEAFAAVGLASMADLGITDDIVNVNGGAIALGHPVGMSGTRVALTLLLELRPPRRRPRRRRPVRRRRPGRRHPAPGLTPTPVRSGSAPRGPGRGSSRLPRASGARPGARGARANRAARR